MSCNLIVLKCENRFIFKVVTVSCEIRQYLYIIKYSKINIKSELLKQWKLRKQSILYQMPDELWPELPYKKNCERNQNLNHD